MLGLCSCLFLLSFLFNNHCLFNAASCASRYVLDVLLAASWLLAVTAREALGWEPLLDLAGNLT